MATQQKMKTGHGILATIRLREWAQDRAALRTGRTTNYQRTGWRERRQRDADAAIVRVVDFENTLAQLTPHQQQILTLAYLCGYSQEETAALTHTNPLSIAYSIQRAREALAEALDRRNLLY